MSNTETPAPATPSQIDEMKKIIDEWSSVPLQTGRTDQAALKAAILKLYAENDVATPPVVVVVPSPYVLTMVGILCTSYYRWVKAAGDNDAWFAMQEGLEALRGLQQYQHVEDAMRQVLGDLPTSKLSRQGEVSKLPPVPVAEYLHGGNLDISVAAFYSAAKQALDIGGPGIETWAECTRRGGQRWVHERFCIVSDFPDILVMTDNSKMHSLTGPCAVWSDGFSIYCIDGKKVPEHVVMRPYTITLDEIAAEKNDDVKAIMQARYDACH